MGVCEKVAEVVTPFLEKEGLRLWDVEFKKEGAEYFLRVYIDRDGGVGIDDCVKVDGFLSPILDELDPIQQSYCFEVSSAGLVRELKRDEHFDRFIGNGSRFILIRALTAFSRRNSTRRLSVTTKKI